MDEVINALKKILQNNSNEMEYNNLFDALKQVYPNITENEYEEILVRHTDIFKWQQCKINNIIKDNTVSLQPIVSPKIPNQQNNPKIEQLPGDVAPMPPSQNNKR